MREKLLDIFSKNRDKILLLLALYVVLTLISQTPYLNWVIPVFDKLTILVVVGIYLFNLPIHYYGILSITFLLFAVVNLFFNQAALAEILGNILYLLLVIIFVIKFSSYLREIDSQGGKI